MPKYEDDKRRLSQDDITPSRDQIDEELAARLEELAARGELITDPLAGYTPEQMKRHRETMDQVYKEFEDRYGSDWLQPPKRSEEDGYPYGAVVSIAKDMLDFGGITLPSRDEPLKPITPPQFLFLLRAVDEAILDACYILDVPPPPGWETEEGVSGLSILRRHEKPS